MSFELRKLWEHAGGRLPDDWSVVSFESLLRDSKSIAVGVMYPGPDTPGGVPLLKVGDVKEGSVPIKPSYCISAATDEEHKRTKLVGDELLITLVGNPGECVVVTPEMAGWNPARAIAVARLQDTSLRTYLKAVLESTAGRHLIDAVLNTTVQKTLNLKDIRKLPIPLPNSATIKHISSFSEALTMRVTLLRETNATLEAIAQALFKSWFVDFDPVHAKAEGREPEGMDATTAALFPDSFEESEPGLVPKGWCYSTVGLSFILTMGQSPPGDTYNETGEGLPFYQGRTDFGFRFPKQRIFCTEPTRLASAGDTLVSVRAPVGDVNIALEPCALGRGVAGLRHPKGHQSFVFYAVRCLKPHFEMYDGEGTVFGSINKKDFQALPVVVPSEEVLRAFEAVVAPLDAAVENNEQKLRSLTQLRDTLLPRLISGQLRLPEAESLLDNAL